ncbi:MAG: porin [Thioalkalivibrionaceae bacterium]
MTQTTPDATKPDTRGLFLRPRGGRHRVAIGTAIVVMFGCGALMPWSIASADQDRGADFDFYGSLRLQVEAVRPGDRNEVDAYEGFRDAYSRVGATAGYTFEGGTRLFGQVEVPLDLANGRVQGPFEQNDTAAHANNQLYDRLRIAKIGVQDERFGTLAFGQDWLPYYNAIAFPVDMFSSYYSGFATFTAFRRNETLAYYSPSFGGFSFAAGYSNDGGNGTASGGLDDRLQFTASYTFAGTTLSFGIDDAGGVGDSRIYGLSLMHTQPDVGPGDLYIGAKIERFDSNLDSGFGADGDTAANLFASYSVGPHTFKGMVADVPSYGETVFHLGYDFQFRDDLKFFVEYYDEEDTAAITTRRGGAADTNFAAQGGRALAVGARFDF